MEIINGILCISHKELTKCIITAENLKKKVQRGKVRQVVKGGNGRSAWYDVESLPLKERTEVYKRHPDAQESAESKAFADMIEHDGAAFRFYEKYTLPDGRKLSVSKVVEYAANVSIMEAFKKCWDAHVSKRQRTGKKAVAAKEFWTRAAAALPRLADRWPHSLPGSARRLQMKMAEYLEQGYACFVSGKYMNGNAAKLLNDEQVGFLASLINISNQLPDTLLADFYNVNCKLYGWSAITPGTVGVWRRKLNLEADAARLGVTNFRNKRTMQVKRSRPTAPFLMCSLDGWTVELLYQKTRTDKKGHNVTTYTNRLTIVVVLDPCVDYPMGYAVGDHECPGLIKAALRDAAKHSRELTGQMLRYNQIQSDRYAIKSMHDLYAILGDKVTPAQAHNAKGKPVEAYFKHLNVTYCQLCSNWSGFGVTTDPMRQPNSEALNRRRHTFPDEQGLRDQIDKMMRLEREGKRDALMKKMAALRPEHRLPMDTETYLLNFGVETGYKNVLEGCGLRPTILGVKRDYDCFDLTFRDHAAERWTVKYDPDDLSQVLAVNEDGTRRYMLEEKYVQPMALADRSESDSRELERVREYNRQLEAMTAQRIAKHRADAEYIINNAPALRGSLEDRLLIPDSRGQHKDNRSRKRCEAHGQYLEVETVEVPIMQHGDSDTETVNYNIF